MNKPAPKIYRTINWSSYNRALINRGNISIWFDPKTQWYAQSQGKQGRNQTYSDTAIQCCLMIKSLFRLSLRMVTGFVQSLIKLSGLDWTAPDYTTLCRRQKHIDIAISYQKSSDGLHLLVDSTGLKFLGEGEWKRKKHGAEYRRQWRKLHIAIDAKTLQIRAVQLPCAAHAPSRARRPCTCGRRRRSRCNARLPARVCRCSCRNPWRLTDSTCYRCRSPRTWTRP